MPERIKHMKKPIVIFLLFVFLSISFQVRAATVSPIQTSVSQPAGTITENQAENAQTSVPAEAQYDLPYPGILLDHPFYFLKRIRDRIMLSLITDPVKKTQFYLLQSDKFLSMVNIYDSKNNWSGIMMAASASVDSMTQAMTQAKQYQSQGGILSGETINQLGKSVAKHIEILTDLTQKAASSDKPALTDFINAFIRLQTNVKALRS
jgi:hypothetical protein